MLCHYHLLVCLSCFVVNCWGSTSEYLIIRHGRSRVRHSSEKDHIRWGLQVFDNFTLLDYDTVDDSNETTNIVSNTVSGSKAHNGVEKVGHLNSFSETGNSSDTLTIQFSESEELDRMIDISDFDSISIGTRNMGLRQPNVNSLENNHILSTSPVAALDLIQSSARLTPALTSMAAASTKGIQQQPKLIKKEIMENIRKTVDKGLEYLKYHKNLDEVKIELKPFRSHVAGGGIDDRPEHTLARNSIDANTILGKVIPSHEQHETRPVEGKRKDYTPVSPPFLALSTTTDAARKLHFFPFSAGDKHWNSVKIHNTGSFSIPSAEAANRNLFTAVRADTAIGLDSIDYANDFPLTGASDFASKNSADELNSQRVHSDKKNYPINPAELNPGNSIEMKFNYAQRKAKPFEPHSSVTFPENDHDNDDEDEEDDGENGKEVINILNDAPTMSFEPSEVDVSSTMIFNGDPELDGPPVWVSDAEDSKVDDVINYRPSEANEIFRLEDIDLSELDETSRNNRRNLMKGRDVVTQFLQIVESQHLLGSNCTAGTALNLGEGVVDRYAQDRFRVEAEIAVNRANMLTRIFKFAAPEVQASEHLLHASVLSMVEFDDDIFAAGNCFDLNQHPAKKGLFCPFAYRLPTPDQGASLAKDLAAEYHYLGNTSEWFFLARKNAEKVISRNEQYIKSFHIYSNNLVRQADEILSVKYEDGRWSKPYYDCGGGNIWMLTYTVPFFGFENGTYFFKGTSGIDIDLRRVDIDQCPQRSSPAGSQQPLNIFAGTDKCKQRTTECTPIPGLGFRRGSYRCVCRKGFYFPDTSLEQKWFNGTTLEEEYEKLMLNEFSSYNGPASYECLPCAEGCDACIDASPCVAALNWTMRTGILVLACTVIGLLPPAALFTFRYQQVKVVRAASPALLRVIALGAFCIYCTSIVMYPPPSLYTCTARIWLREIGFSLTYGALMLKTWRISVIFRVRSAKAVKITDAYLLKRLGVLCGFVGIALLVRTLVAPPVVIVGRTADNLKAFLCKTDWWDHTFTSMEVLFLAWGVRLCIMVRKAPSEFNESRFISMAIYNEFLLTCFLNVSMLFLQSPANPDLLYIIFFCHTQLTVTLLLGLIFGSKVYLVFRGGGKHQDDSTGLGIKPSGAKFISRSHGRTFANASSVTTSTAQLGGIMVNEGRLTEEEAIDEIKELHNQLQRLYDRVPQRGVAIITIACLMETCKSSSLKPPPPPGVKAIMTAPDSKLTKVVDKGINTDTLMNGNYGSSPWQESDTRIMITDDSYHNDRSKDNSKFSLDILQLKCMCSDDDVGERREASECHSEAVVCSCNKIGCSIKHADCCDSVREHTKPVLAKQISEHTLTNRTCSDGESRNYIDNQSEEKCISGSRTRLGELSVKNYESCDNLLHQQQKQRHILTMCDDSIANHCNQRPNSGECGLMATASSRSVDESNFRNLNLENFNKLYASHNNKIDSLKENFLMRTALTTALSNLENENRLRSNRISATSIQFQPIVDQMRPLNPCSSTTMVTSTITTAGAVCSGSGNNNCNTPTPSCSSSGTPTTIATSSTSAMAPVQTDTDLEANVSGSLATGGQHTGKKKKSPEKRLVIDLNDRSKYTEEVSV
ncbi:uncharacterized protein LOC131436379 [Malaya genurostris]|uniref:uncharacterized protein LOC131436379 n=1 Tax=Malaya genurostris TaxID=325434 RepID=UPI0026F38AF3|nr:uncharacterized protein LOC131436379 [Malaya genurostris]XP_058461060.1 uncharacterized protein LOC131436379 [Malaya genurostris]